VGQYSQDKTDSLRYDSRTGSPKKPILTVGSSGITALGGVAQQSFQARRTSLLSAAPGTGVFAGLRSDMLYEDAFAISAERGGAPETRFVTSSSSVYLFRLTGQKKPTAKHAGGCS